VENALAGRLEMLTDRVQHGQDISDEILGTVRLVMAEALRQEFEPAMQRYLDRLVDALPSRLDFNLDLSSIGAVSQTTSSEDFRWKDLATTLAPMLIKVPKIGPVLAPLVIALGTLFDSKATQQRQQLEEARQREKIKSRIHAALSDAVRQIDSQLRPVLNEQVQKAQAEVARNVDAERDEVKRTLSTLIAALQQGDAETAALRNEALKDLDSLNNLLAELTPAN
jgi:hypothetical protein